MRRHALISIIAGSSLAIASCAGSDDVADESANTTLAPESVPATEPAATEPTATDPEPTEPPVTEAPTSEPPATEVPSIEPATTTTITPAGAAGDISAAFAVPPGAASTVSALSFDDTVASATAVIEGNEALTLVATIDHAANAANAGLDLPPTTELIFGNPTIGTPLMAASPIVGIDLPQKMLVTQVEDGSVQIIWNVSSYLAGRHGLTGVDEQLDTIDTSLTSIASAAAGNGDGVEPTVGPDVAAGAGLVTRDGVGTAREAVDRLLAAIDENTNLVLVAEIDHAANAASAGLELPPIIEVVFGNPNLGTPLMQASRTVGIDLPQKMLFVENEGGITITYNDPSYLAERHGIDPATPELSMIAGALEALSGVAADTGA